MLGSALLVELAMPAASAGTQAGSSFVVTSLADPGDGSCDATCTIRDAVDASNDHVGEDSITFQVSGTIVLVSPAQGGGPLPDITDPVAIESFIGVSIDGSQAGNAADGVVVRADGTTIGNLDLHGFGGSGVTIAGASGVVIHDSYIHDNGGSGLLLTDGASNNVIGAPTSGERQYASLGTIGGNTIVENAGAGIAVTSGDSNTMRTNVIFGNGGIAIDLGDDGVTPNDDGDADVGPNRLQNAPVIKAGRPDAEAGVSAWGSLDAAPSTRFDIDFFRNAGCPGADGSVPEYWVGSIVVDTDVSGHADFSLGWWYTVGPEMLPGEGVSATATNLATGDSSEHSTCSVIKEAHLSIEVDGGSGETPVGDTVTYTATIRNEGPDVAEGTRFSALAVSNEPRTAEIVSVELSQGSCPIPGDHVIWCKVGDLAAGSELVAIVVVRPLMPARFDTFFTVVSMSFEPDPTTDQAQRMFRAICTIEGDDRSQTIIGTPGDDVICDRGGDDTIEGKGGDDLILLGSGDDIVIGGAGQDTASYALDRDGVRASLSDGLSTGRGLDRLRGIESLIGSRGPDVLIGDDHDNMLRGMGGLDRLAGRGGRDRFFARNRRADAIHGGAGQDVAKVDAAKDDVYSARRIQ